MAGAPAFERPGAEPDAAGRAHRPLPVLAAHRARRHGTGLPRRARRRPVRAARRDQAGAAGHGDGRGPRGVSRTSARSSPRSSTRNIARLLDGGATRAGRAVLRHGARRGRARSDVLPRRAGSPSATAAALLGRCATRWQYAHQHLVVHRDLKPCNMLVTRRRRVKLLDFGIAKVLGGEGAAARGAERHADCAS